MIRRLERVHQQYKRPSACWAVVLGPVPRLLDRSIPLDNTQQNHSNRQDEQDVDEATERVGGDDPEKPQNQEYDEDSPEQ